MILVNFLLIGGILANRLLWTKSGQCFNVLIINQRNLVFTSDITA